MSQDDLKGKYALVTGASSGLGRALVIEYASNGCNIIMVGRSLDKLSNLRNEINSIYPGDHWIQVCDLSNADDITNMLDSNFPSVDILVNAAGVFPISKISDMSMEEYEQCINVNVTAPFILIKELSMLAALQPLPIVHRNMLFWACLDLCIKNLKNITYELYVFLQAL